MALGGFVGRSEELASLVAALRAAATGSLHVAIVEGEAGIGKSALVDQVVEEAAALGFETFAGAGEELGRARPFGPLVDALGCVAGSEDPRRAAIARDLREGELSTADAGPTYHRVVDGFERLLEEQALAGPLLLVCEDLHWADDATVFALHSLIRRLRLLPIVVLLTVRPHPRRSVGRAHAAWRDDQALQISLPPLPVHEVEELARMLLGADPDAPLQEFVAGAAGNPLFIAELVLALLAEDAISVENGRALLVAPTVPPSLRMTILRRLSFLSERALDVLRYGAVLGASFSPGDVATVMGESLPALLGPLEEGRGARLIEEHGRRMRFRHDLIRQVLYEDLPEAMRVALHRHAARALDAAGASAAQVAQHHALGAQPGDREAIEALRRAAGAGRCEPRMAAVLLEQALALVSPGDPVAADVSTEIAEALAWGGRPLEAEARAREALGRRPQAPERIGRARGVLIHALRSSARWSEIVSLTDEWLADADMTQAEHVELLATNAHARAWSNEHDVRRAVADAERAVALGESLGDEPALCRALVALALARDAAIMPGAVEAAVRASELVERDPRPDLLRSRPHHVLGSIHPDPDARERALRTGLRLAEERGWLTDVPDYLTALAYVHEARDAWDEAIAESEAALSAAEEVGALHAALMAHSYLAFYAVGRGDLAAAEAHLAAEEALYETLGPQILDLPMMLRALLLEARGDLDGVLALRWDAFRQACEQRQLVPWKSLIFLAIERDPSKAAAVVDWLESRADWLGSDSAIREARFGRSLFDRDAEAMRAVVHEAEAAGWPDPTFNPDCAARGLGWVGLTDEAVPHARRAIERWVTADAREYMRWFVSAMRKLGVPIAPPRRRARPATGWEALTDSEQRVAALAAEGRTNRKIGEALFISPRTVQAHLAHIFRKLGISSRVELATAVARRSAELTEDPSSDPAPRSPKTARAASRATR